MNQIVGRLSFNQAARNVVLKDRCGFGSGGGSAANQSTARLQQSNVIELLEGRRLMSVAATPIGIPHSDLILRHFARHELSIAQHIPSMVRPSVHRVANADWPPAPFHQREFRDGTTIYVNQNGFALLKGQTVSAQHPFDDYDLFFDDGGSARISTSGTLQTDVAVYGGDGLPTAVDKSGATTPVVTSVISPNKVNGYVGVRPHTAGQSGVFDLKIDGVPEGVLDYVRISPKLNAGSGGTSISGANDYDFWQFTVPRTGNWVVKAIPDLGHNDFGGSQPLDVTLNVYDRKGNPIGGSFTQSINTGGAGKVESWTGIGLPAGSSYYFRVDGAGESVGGYGVSVVLANLPDVTVQANHPLASATGGSPGQFTISRSDTTRHSVVVPYTLSGTAVNGQDYQGITGFAVIPRHQLSTTVTIQPIAGNTFNIDKSVVLSLSASADYNVGSANSAVVIIKK